MGPIYQLTLEEERFLEECLDNMIRGEKFRPSSGQFGSPTFFVPKPV
jgi:hypothetical protein